jgi:hypothetical protein
MVGVATVAMLVRVIGITAIHRFELLKLPGPLVPSRLAD